MRKIISLLLCLCLQKVVPAQSFEGRITYKVTIKSKIPKVTDQQMTQMLGSTQQYFTNGSDYRSNTNGSYLLWQLYINKDNKIYNKATNSEAILWYDGNDNADTITQVEVKKGVMQILGYSCDQITFTTKSGIEKYYFNAKFSVDPTSYVNHKFGNWYDFVSRSKALPLKSIVENPQFVMESEATEVKEMKMPEHFFELPPDVKTSKAPD